MIYEFYLEMAVITAVAILDLLGIGIRIVSGAASGKLAGALQGRIIGAAVTGRIELDGQWICAGIASILLGNLAAPSPNDRVISCREEGNWQQRKP